MYEREMGRCISHVVDKRGKASKMYAARKYRRWVRDLKTRRCYGSACYVFCALFMSRDFLEFREPRRRCRDTDSERVVIRRRTLSRATRDRAETLKYTSFDFNWNRFALTKCLDVKQRWNIVRNITSVWLRSVGFHLALVALYLARHQIADTF